MSELRRTPLYEIHRKIGGKIVGFAGWEMPVQYEGVKKEHKAVRERVGIFDVSHMGEIEVAGEKALEFCQKISTNDAFVLSTGDVQYSCFCMPEGGVVDDFTLFKRGEDNYLFIVNAANKDKDLAWMRKNAIEGARIEDLSDEYSLLAVQGPYSEKILKGIFKEDLSKIKFYSFIKTSFSDVEVMLSRTGYTGEDGFEIMIENNAVCELWREIQKQGISFGIAPVGLGARDTLRMEMGYALYGHELTDEISPIQAGLGWIVKFKKDDFIGKSVLSDQKTKGLSVRFTGFKLKERGVPREKCRIFKGTCDVGWVSSGSYSPTMECGFGLCYVKKDISNGEDVEVEIRGKMFAATLSKPPFVKGSIKK